MPRIKYNRDFDLVIPEEMANVPNPIKYLKEIGADLEDYLSPRRAKRGFSEKSGPKGSRKGYK